MNHCRYPLVPPTLYVIDFWRKSLMFFHYFCSRSCSVVRKNMFLSPIHVWICRHGYSLPHFSGMLCLLPSFDSSNSCERHCANPILVYSGNSIHVPNYVHMLLLQHRYRPLLFYTSIFMSPISTVQPWPSPTPIFDKHFRCPTLGQCGSTWIQVMVCSGIMLPTMMYRTAGQGVLAPYL